LYVAARTFFVCSTYAPKFEVFARRRTYRTRFVSRARARGTGGGKP